jgi:hypothetical protein
VALGIAERGRAASPFRPRLGIMAGTGSNSVSDSEKPETTRDVKAVTPCCTGCKGTGYSYR